MNKDKVKEILDKTNIYVLDEANIIEYIDEQENKINKAIDYIEELCMFIDKDGKKCYLHYGDDLSPNTLINILRGNNEED